MQFLNSRSESNPIVAYALKATSDYKTMNSIKERDQECEWGRLNFMKQISIWRSNCKNKVGFPFPLTSILGLLVP